MQAVLTGDIVNSTKLTTINEKRLLESLKKVLSPYKYEFYRGDSFQVYLRNADKALQTALLCRTAAIRIPAEGKLTHGDIRISIGIGRVNAPIKKLSAAKGEAFVLSGRMFDEITKKDTRLAIVTGNLVANLGLQVIADYLNSIYSMMTDKQAAVIFELLNGRTQKNVADKLRKSKSTISQHVMAGRLYEIEKLLRQFEGIVGHLK